MNSRLARIFNTFTFRLALVYVGLFSLSVILLFAFIFTFARSYTETLVSDSIRQQYSYLLNAYRDGGSQGVEERIRQLIAEDDEGKEIYIFTNRDYEKLSGNLNEWPKSERKADNIGEKGKWVTFRIESVRNVSEGIEVRAFVIPLSKWRYLLVGQSTQGIERVEQIITQTFWASLLITLVMAFVGAIVMTRSVMRRINVINRASARIMHGNLSIRIPYTKGGDEFDELSQNLNQMLDKIEILLQSISLFANNIAHDLRTPLNRIISRLDAHLRKITSENPARNVLEKNIQDMEGLVATFNSILRISELEASTEFRQFDTVDLGAIMTDLVELYEPLATEKNIHLENRIAPNSSVRGERHLLTQAFANLIDNAIKFTPSGGFIIIAEEYHQSGSESLHDIIIADSGEGIPEGLRDKVFEKFFRLEESRHTKGNGLGLSLVAAIARIHQANVMLENNEPGLRVRFRMTR